MWQVIKNSYVIISHFANEKIDMGLLKCDVTMKTAHSKKAMGYIPM